MRSPRTVDPRILASPLRAEIIGHLQTDGPQSIRELAARLARPASGLYHHVRLLERSGILVERERRKSGRREEVVYALTAPRAAIRDAAWSLESSRTNVATPRPLPSSFALQ